MAPTVSYRAVPSMLIVQPMGNTKRVTRLSMRWISSRQRNVTGRVAILYRQNITESWTHYDSQTDGLTDGRTDIYRERESERERERERERGREGERERGRGREGERERARERERAGERERESVSE